VSVSHETQMSERYRLGGADERAVPGLGVGYSSMLVMLLCLAGCQKSNLPLVLVDGKITYAGGDWPKPGMLFFTIKEPGPNLPRRPGNAVLATDGTFRAKTFSDRDGLVPGKYVITMECWKQMPTMTKAGISYVPERYQSGALSDIIVDVREDAESPLKLEFDIPKK
jgi:hypothetical protein